MKPLEQRPVRKRSRFGVRLLVVLGATLLTCALMEGGMRVFLATRGQPYSREKGLAGMRHMVDQMTRREAQADFDTPEPQGGIDDAEFQRRARSRSVLHPYVGFETAYSFEQIDKHTAHFKSPAAKQTFDVLVLGGSVAANFGNEMPRDLAALLAPLPIVAGRPVLTYSYGRGSYKQPQQVTMLAWLLSLGFQPDLVINIDGFNEVAVANFNLGLNAHPLYPSIAQWASLARGGVTDPEVLDFALPVRRAQVAAQELLRSAEDSFTMHSALLGHFQHARLRGLHRQWSRGQRELVQRFLATKDDPILRGPTYEAPKGQAIQDCVRAWMECVQMLQAMCDARGIAFINCLQPTLHDAGSKPLTAEEQASSQAIEAWTEGVSLGYPMLRTAARRLAGQGVRIVDATQVFAEVEETLYYDACHFNSLGNRILAKRIVEALTEFDAAPSLEASPAIDR